MGRCIIICPLWQGECLEELTPRQGDLLLCADGGYAEALRRGLRPDLVIGDFDTLPPPQEGALPVRRLPVMKDDTDLGACIAEGRSRGYRSFLLAGCIGGRIDHTLAMLQLMADCANRGEIAWAVDAVSLVTVLGPGIYTLPRHGDRLLSLLAFTPKVRGVCLSGTAWTLEDAELSCTRPLGISNIITAGEARLSFREGLLTVSYAFNRTADPRNHGDVR